jgi:indolepyruvate ferredoxin oxidoreductase
MLRMREGRTHVALNSHSTPTAAFVRDGNWQNPAEACAAEIAQAVGSTAWVAFNADAAATKLMGDSIYTNPMMLGYAWQKGWIPLGRATSLMRAIELNAVQVDNNKAAFEWGRRAAHDWASVEKLLTPAQVLQFKKRETLDDHRQPPRRVPDRLPGRGLRGAVPGFVDKVRQPRRAGQDAADRSVARYLFKLMAYKDEYEVARLHTDTGLPGQGWTPCSKATSS